MNGFDEIRARLPVGRSLPEALESFVHAFHSSRVIWDDLDAFDLKSSASQELLPFLRLSDGGIVSLWYQADPPAVVHLGSEGERRVVAADFSAFVGEVEHRRATSQDAHDAVEEVVFDGAQAAELIELQSLFDDFCKKHDWLLEPLRTAQAEELRQRVHQIAKTMIDDGCSKVYSRDSKWWRKDFRIKRVGGKTFITYLDYGAWHPVPTKYELAEPVEALLELVKDKDREQFELSTNYSGIVSIDRDRQLVIVPPGEE
jgi:hypothetical protein